jgi:L-threo-3-deoxy-hexylosonate aldolase
VRQSFNDAGFEHLPAIVGASGQSVFETINLRLQAATAGGDYVLVLPPSYCKAAMTDDAIFNSCKAVAATSPVPLILYSFPAVLAVIDMSSDLLIRLSKACNNVVGTKFTCGGTGKFARVARAMEASDCPIS